MSPSDYAHMKQSKRYSAFMGFTTMVIMLLLQGTSAAALSGIATMAEPDWFKISINQQETLDLQVEASNMTGNMTLGVAVTLGINSDFGETLYLAADVLNSTKNASLSYVQVDPTPIYLAVFFITDENSSVAINYTITCSHPIITYSYSQYYNEVVYPEIVTKTTIIGILIGGIALMVTIYFLRKRQREKALSLL